MTRTLKTWLPVAMWTAVMFVMSTDLGSATHTSRIIEPILRWLIPGISPDSVSLTEFVVRKGGHLCEYLILALLTLRAVGASMHTSAPAWSWRAAWLALFFAAAYAVTDEFHQSFIPSRTASAYDVVLDTCGAVVGLSLAFLRTRWTQIREQVRQPD
jgi:VanZ family protein